jgi:hypothetical protein
MKRNKQERRVKGNLGPLMLSRALGARVRVGGTERDGGEVWLVCTLRHVKMATYFCEESCIQGVILYSTCVR